MTSRSSRELAAYTRSLVDQVGSQIELAAALQVDASAVSRACAGTFSTLFLAAVHCRFDSGSGRYIQTSAPEVGPAAEDKRAREIAALKATVASQREMIAGLRAESTALRRTIAGLRGALSAARKTVIEEAA